MTPMDRNSFILGMVAAFCECVAGGAKPLALSPPLTHQDYAQVGQEAMTMAQRHGLVAYHEENLDLPQPERFHWVVVSRDQERLEAYLARLEEKRAILDALLADYNDGRRKTLFNTAVYLLPLEDLRSVIAALDSRPELAAQPIKERALAAVELLQNAADRLGISLKLNKKPKKE